jgi:hypothetical protein
MAQPPTVQEIIDKIIDAITPELVAAKAQAWRTWPVMFDLGADISALRSPADAVTLASGEVVENINSWVFKPQSMRQSGPEQDSTRRELAWRYPVLVTYVIDMWYVLELVAATYQATWLQAQTHVLGDVRRKLNAVPRLGFAELDGAQAGQAQFIQRHDRLQCAIFDDFQFADCRAIVAQCSLAVHVIEPAPK